MIQLTLLSRAIAHAQRSIAAISCVCASIELLVATPLESSANVHEGVTLDLEWTVGVARILDGSGGDATKCGGEGLKVAAGLAALGGESSGRAECGGDEGCDDDRGLHFDDVDLGVGGMVGLGI